MVVQGSSNNADTKEAIIDALTVALSKSDNSFKPSWCMIFAGGKHDKDIIHSELKNKIGDIPVVGGSVIGTVDSEKFSYSHYEISLLIFSNDLEPKIISSSSLNNGEFEAGKKLGLEMQNLVEDGDNIIVFYDSIQSTPPPKLYVGGALLDGIYSILDHNKVNILGGGLVGDYQMSNSFIFDGTVVEKHLAVAIVLPSKLKNYNQIMHGCQPISSLLTITDISGPEILEIDGQPALDVILELTGQDKSEESLKRMCMGITIGKCYGDPFDDYDESKFVNRLIIMANPEKGSVIIFDDDFEVGTEIQLMSRDNDLMLESARSGVLKFNEEIKGKNHIFSLYVNCAGRSCAWSGGEEEEASVITQESNNDIPLLGAYIGVEFTPVLGKTYPVDWNGVLSAFYLND